MVKGSKIENIKTANLVPYARNARTHSDTQVGQIMASIREFGFTNPVLIDADDGIIAGHGRVMAAQRMDMAEVPCIRLSHLTKAQKQAYIIADNKLALNSGWDDELLKIELGELGELAELDFDLSLTGFGVEEMALMFDTGEPSLQSTTKEIDPDSYNMDCKCPKCGFEFDS